MKEPVKYINTEEVRPVVWDRMSFEDRREFLNPEWVKWKERYPIGGYAPGGYQCRCMTCKELFQGDKRAHQCESCAERDVVTHKWILEILDWITENYKVTTIKPGGCYDIVTGGKPLFDAYNKDRINKMFTQLKLFNDETTNTLPGLDSCK